MTNRKWNLNAFYALVFLLGALWARYGLADTYWLTEDGTNGWVPTNVWIDLPVQVDDVDQPAAIGRMALNTVISAGPSTLTHTDPRSTWTVSFSTTAAETMLETTVGPAKASEVLVTAIAAQLVAAGELDSVTVKQTGPAGTVTVAEYGP